MVVTELVAQIVDLVAHGLIGLVAEDTVGGRAGTDAGRRLGKGFGPAELRFLVGLALDGVDYDIEIEAGRETELLFKLGLFLEAGGVVV